jgi:hypothetical protein
MKSLQELLFESLKIKSGSDIQSKATDILDVNIKDFDHLKEILLKYLNFIDKYPATATKISNTPVKWKNTKDSMLSMVSKIETIEVKKHFRIDLYFRSKITCCIECGIYNDEFVFQMKTKGPVTNFHKHDIIGIQDEYGYSPTNPLKPGRNLYEWLIDLKNIKNGDEPHFTNKIFLNVIEIK